MTSGRPSWPWSDLAIGLGGASGPSPGAATSATRDRTTTPTAAVIAMRLLCMIFLCTLIQVGVWSRGTMWLIPRMTGSVRCSLCSIHCDRPGLPLALTLDDASLIARACPLPLHSALSALTSVTDRSRDEDMAPPRRCKKGVWSLQRAVPGTHLERSDAREAPGG